MHARRKRSFQLAKCDIVSVVVAVGVFVVANVVTGVAVGVSIAADVVVGVTLSQVVVAKLYEGNMRYVRMRHNYTNNKTVQVESSFSKPLRNNDTRS